MEVDALYSMIMRLYLECCVQFGLLYTRKRQTGPGWAEEVDQDSEVCGVQEEAERAGFVQTGEEKTGGEGGVIPFFTWLMGRCKDEEPDCDHTGSKTKWNEEGLDCENFYSW